MVQQVFGKITEAVSYYLKLADRKFEKMNLEQAVLREADWSVYLSDGTLEPTMEQGSALDQAEANPWVRGKRNSSRGDTCLSSPSIDVPGGT